MAFASAAAASPAIVATTPRVTHLGPPLPPAGDLVGAIELALVRDWPRTGTVVALDRASGRLMLAKAGGTLVRVWGGRGDWDGLFVEPVDVAPDGEGGVWVADAGRQTLERFDAAGRYVGRVTLPTGNTLQRVVALEDLDRFVVQAGRTLIDVGPDGVVRATTRLGFEPLALASLSGLDLAAVAAGAQGPIVRIMSTDGRIWDSWSLTADDLSVLHPADISARDGTLLVADADRDRVVRYTLDGEGVAAWGGQGFGGGTFEPGCCIGPSSVVESDLGPVFVADDGLGLVQWFDPDGTYVAEWGGVARQPGRFNHPADVAIAADGDLIVLDSDNFRIQRVAPDGTPRWTVGHFGDGEVEFGADVDSSYPSQRGPTSLAIGPTRPMRPGVEPFDDELVVVLDVWNRRIERYLAAGGVYLDILPDTFSVPLEVPGTRDVHAVIAIGPDGAPNAGSIVLLAPESGRVIRYADDMTIEAEWSLDDAFVSPGHPRAMAIGPDGTVWLVAGPAMAGIAPDGTMVAESALEGFDAFCSPEGPVRLTVGRSAEGPLRAYVAQSDCSEVLTYELSGALVGTMGVAGELLGAGLGRPMGMALDPSGGLWVTDAADDRVRRLIDPTAGGDAQAVGAAQPVSARDLATARDLAAGRGAWLARSDTVADAALVDAFGPDGGWQARRRYRCYPLPVPGRETEPRRPLDHGIGPEVRMERAGESLVLSIVDPGGPSCLLFVGADGHVAGHIALTETARILDVAAHQGDHGPPLPPHRIWLARDGLPVMAFDGITGARLPDLPLVADALAALPDGGLLAVLDGGDELARVAPDGTIAQRWPSPDRAFAPHVAADAAGTMYVGAGPTVEVRDTGGALEDTWTLDAPVRGLAAGDDGRVLALVGRVLPERLVEIRASVSGPLPPETPSWLRIDRAVRHAGRWVAEWPTGGADAPPVAPEEEATARRFRFTCPPDVLADGCSARLDGALATTPGEVLALVVEGGARLWLGERLVVDAWDAARVDRAVRVPNGGAASGEAGAAPGSDVGTTLRLEVNRGDGAAIEVRLEVARGGVYLPVGWR